MRSNAFHSSSLDADINSGAPSALGSAEPGFEEVEDALERDRLLRYVHAASRQLSEEDQTLLRLRYTEGRTQAAIGEMIGVSQMTVSRRLQKLLTALRAELTSARNASPVQRSMARRASPTPRQPRRT